MRDAIGYQSKGVFFGSHNLAQAPSACDAQQSSSEGSALSDGTTVSFKTRSLALELPGQHNGQKQIDLNKSQQPVQSSAPTVLIESDAAQMPLLLLSDTVSLALGPKNRMGKLDGGPVKS